MEKNGFHRKEAARSLQQAASTIFVLMGLMPFLIFVYVAHLLGAINDLRVQLGLAAALAISMLGFAVLLSTMRKTSAVLQMLVRAEGPRHAAPIARPEARAGAARAEARRAAASRAEPSPPDAPRGEPATDGAARPEPPAEHAPAAPVKLAASTRSAAATAVDTAPAIGSIRELRDAAEAVGRRWRAEAEQLVGRAVRVGVVNFEQPETGILSRISDDGLVLEQDGQEFGVLWRFVSSVELYGGAEAELAGQSG